MQIPIRMKKAIGIALLIACALGCPKAHAQLNTDRITAIGRNALYFDDYVLSIQYFNQVIKLKPWLAEPYLYRAIAKIQLGDYKGAESDCDHAIANNPFLPGAYYTRGFVYRQQQRYGEAEKDFTEALIFAPENKTYILLRADVRAQNNDFDGATEDIDYLLKREPRSANLNFEKGTICIARKDTLCALASFTEAIRYDSQNAANWSARGLVNMLLNNETDALNDLTRAIELDSKWAGDYINRGIIYYKNHNYRGALADYDKAVQYDPRNAQCYYNRGLLRAELGDWNRALDDLNTAINLDPDNIEMYYQRGVVNLQLRQWQDAVTDFDLLISTYPYFLPAYYLAAQAKTALNDTKSAYRYQQKARDLEDRKEEIQRTQNAVNTDVQLADNRPRKDRRKEFSNRAAQNLSDPQEETVYQSEARGTIQKRYADVINEPNITLSYYAQNQSLRRTNYSHWAVDDYNKSGVLPSTLRFTVQELSLTADLVETHFDAINRLSEQIDLHPDLPDLYFARAIEFALVQDYSSAIDDCTQTLLLRPDFGIACFCRANWRYKHLEYQRNTQDLSTLAQQDDARLNTKMDFELILRDLDQTVKLLPDFAFAYYNKANMLCAQKDFAAAIACYTQAIDADPDFAEAWFNRGLTRIFIDDADQGIADLSKAGELGIYQAYNLITRLQ